MRRAVRRLVVGGLLGVAGLMISGLFLADHLTPPNTGTPSQALAPRADQTALDRAVTPLTARHPGQSGAILLADGIDAFAARAIVARQAGRSLDLQYYIWKDDPVGHLLLAELWQAAERGVRVRLLLDDINTAGHDVALLALSRHPNLEIRVYNPFRNRSGLWRLVEMVQRGWSLNHRMHNKAWIADGQVAIVGGRNIGEAYFQAAAATNFRDLDLMLAGPVVGQTAGSFDTYWNSDAVVPIAVLERRGDSMLKAALARIADSARGEAAQRYLARVRESTGLLRFVEQGRPMRWTGSLRLLADPPVKRATDDRSNWLYRQLIADIEAARHEVLLISPYFVPGDGAAALLARVLERPSGRVAVVTNSLAATDVLAVHSGYRRYRPDLLRRGIDLFEMRAMLESGFSMFGSSNSSLHTKAWLIDGRQGFIGSFNIDPRSAFLNTEMGVVFDDPVLGGWLRDEFELLASPAFSYRPILDASGRLHWRDDADGVSRILDREPASTLWQRLLVAVLGWLPIESQL